MFHLAWHSGDVTIIYKLKFIQKRRGIYFLLKAFSFATSKTYEKSYTKHFSLVLKVGFKWLLN